jgi:hypothetical protein
MNRFEQLIDEPAPPPDLRPAGELVQPLEDLAKAIRAKRPSVDASVVPSKDGKRYHLALWPRHRPAFRSLMVTVHLADGRGAVLGNPIFWFTSADDLTGWLENFVQGPAFRASLDELSMAATEPVDARLERTNGMATLATVSPEQQEALDGIAVGDELTIDLPLNEREPVPDPAALRRLDAAGLHFAIREATLIARTVHLRVVRLP